MSTATVVMSGTPVTPRSNHRRAPAAISGSGAASALVAEVVQAAGEPSDEASVVAAREVRGPLVS